MDYKKQLAEAEKRLLDLEQQKRAIEKQMLGWAQVMQGLQVLTQQESADEAAEPPAKLEAPSFTGAIRQVLQKHGLAMSPTQIRDAVVSSGIQVGSKNLLINIHTVLDRLERAREVVSETRADGSRGYRWMSPVVRALTPDPTPAFGAPTSLAKMIARKTKARNACGRKP